MSEVKRARKGWKDTIIEPLLIVIITVIFRAHLNINCTNKIHKKKAKKYLHKSHLFIVSL